MGAAYELDGDVYFSVESDRHFGEVSHYDAALMRRLSAERGGDPDRPGKKNPLDPVLWLAARDGEPSWDGAPSAPDDRAGTSSASPSRWTTSAWASTSRAAAPT